MKPATTKINIILIILICFILGLWLIASNKNNSLTMDPLIGFVYPQAKHIDDFNLIDFDEKTVTKSHFTGKWWVAYFGFTYCPDACPLALGDMKKIKQNMSDTAKSNTEFVFISVDPDRDTPVRLKQYVQYFDQAFYALTGQADELEKVANNMGVAFVVPENPVDENYLVGHSSFLLLLNPNMDLVAVFQTPHNAKVLAEEIFKIQDYFNDS